MTLRASPAHLARLAGGRPMVIVVEGVMDPSPLVTPSLDVWMASDRAGTTLLHPAGTRAPDPAETAALDVPPASAIALVASERLRVARLSRWWAEASGLLAPPFLLAATGQAALPGLLTLVTEALVAARAGGGEAAGALVAGRREAEAGREAMAEAARYLAHRPATAPRLVLTGEPGPAPALTGPFRQPLGTGLAGLAALAIHPAGKGSGDGLLRVRLIGAESGRVAGCWAVPSAALAPGWLTLDLPTPLGPLKETALLEVTPEGEGLPGLSRDARWSGTEGEHGVAASAWAGTPGSRYIAPAWWMPEEAGLILPSGDIPLALPESVLASARTLEGEAQAIALGDEPPHPVLRAAGGGQAVLILPHLQLPGLDRLRIAFESAEGDGLSVAAWVYPVEAAPRDGAGLDHLPPGAAGTSWRDVPAEGVELTLPLSSRLTGRACLAIALRAGQGPAAVEVVRITASAAGNTAATMSPPPAREPIPAPVPRKEEPGVAAPPPPRPVVAPVPPPERPMPAPSPSPAASPSAAPLPAPTLASPQPPAPPRPVPPAPPTRVSPAQPAQRTAPAARFETVRLHQHLPGASYRHLDLSILSLASGPGRWPSVRVKVQSKDLEPRLEFRQAAGWPQAFRDWLGRSSDKFGPFLRVSGPELRAFLDTMTDERDAAMMQALLDALPRAVEDACRQAGLSVADTAAWAETAKALRQEAQRPAA